MPRFKPDTDHAPLPRLQTEADRALRLSTAIEAAQHYATESLSAATRRALTMTGNTSWPGATAWTSLPCLPAPSRLPPLFPDEAKRRERAISTLHRRLAAIGVAHRQHGLLSPHQDTAVQRVMQGIRNNNKERKPVKKAPLIAACTVCQQYANTVELANRAKTAE